MPPMHECNTSSHTKRHPTSQLPHAQTAARLLQDIARKSFNLDGTPGMGAQIDGIGWVEESRVVRWWSVELPGQQHVF